MTSGLDHNFYIRDGALISNDSAALHAFRKIVDISRILDHEVLSCVFLIASRTCRRSHILHKLWDDLLYDPEVHLPYQKFHHKKLFEICDLVSHVGAILLHCL